MSAVPARKGARRDAGGPPTHHDIAEALSDLESRPTPQLRAEWRRLCRTEPPTRLSRDLLLRGIAHRLQEGIHGGLGIGLRRHLDTLAAQFDEKCPPGFTPSATLKPGTRLVREWHGRAHAVIVLDDGFEYQGERYSSLSRIATLITGARWSGPVFFGLKKRPGPPAERSDG